MKLLKEYFLGETIESDLDENLCSQSDGSIKEEAYLAAASESNCRLKHVDKGRLIIY